MEITEQDIRNNPGVDINTIQSVKEQYHFHKLASVTLHDHTLICTFAPDPDPTSIFYTPLERSAEPVREYEVGEVKGDVSITSDGLAVTFGDVYISSEEIWAGVC